jgi:hypothetical protein
MYRRRAGIYELPIDSESNTRCLSVTAATIRFDSLDRGLRRKDWLPCLQGTKALKPANAKVRIPPPQPASHGRAQGQLPDLSGAHSDGSGRGHGETARSYVRWSAHCADRAREVLRRAHRRAEGALQFAAFSVPAGGVSEQRPQRSCGSLWLQSIVVTLGPAVFDQHVATFDIAGLARAWRKAAATCAYSQAEAPLRNPMTGIARCCAASRQFFR